MKTIWKFDLLVAANLTIDLPIGAELLSIQVQRGYPRLWAIVEPANEKERRSFRIVGTGEKVESFDGLRFVGTYQINGGDYVFHLFEVIK